MKIKQRNIGLIIFTSIGTVVYIYALIHGIISTQHYFSDFSVRAYISNGMFILVIVYLFVGTISGSFIEIKGNIIIRAEGFLEKRFALEQIKRIYCAHHVFLGPSMFLEYKEDELSAGKEDKLLVLNLYPAEGKKALLNFLREKYPNIQQDKNCDKIRNGEKILTTWNE